MVTSFKHYNYVTDRREASVRSTCGCSFLSFPRAGTGRIISYAVSYIGRNARKPIFGVSDKVMPKTSLLR